MAFKLVIACVVLATASAGVIESGWQQPAGWQQPSGWQQPAYVQPTVVKQIQPAIVKQVAYEQPANYEFNYDVHDTHTGDIKRQWEKAENGVVTGEYALVDPDGYRRTVSYSADAHHGFQAKVQREPYAHAPAHGWQQPTVVKVAAPSHGWQQPSIVKVAQPAVVKVQAASHGWQAPSHGWQQPAVVKVQAPSHGWQPAPSHGWQQPAVVKVQAPSHGWQANPWA